MTPFHNLLQHMRMRLKGFLRSEKGMTLPLLAVSMFALTGVVGIAIDTSRAQLVQSKLQFSLDAAGLAAGSTVSTSALNTEVTKYLNTNFNGYLGAKLTGTNATVDSTNTVITLSATAQLPTTFMDALGVSKITVNANSQISRGMTGLELVMVLDNTGSMANSAGGSQSKLQALQTAANALLNTLFQGNPPAGKLWVGIVPFSQAVNIGTSHTAWMDTAYDNTISGMSSSVGPGWGPTSWGGCVDARQNGEDTTDDPPVTSTTKTLFQQYYWPSDAFSYGSPWNNTPNGGSNKWAHKQYKRCKTNGTSCTTYTDSCTAPSGYVCTFTGYSYASPLNNTSQGPNLLCPQQVTPMTNVKSTLQTTINSMTAQGNTVIPQGLQWGWNMLSPRWRGQWGGTMNANGLPLDYNTQGMQKVIVLLTDGQNTIDNSSHSSYWFLENNRLGTTSASGGITALDTRTKTLCTAIKNAGIFIYTIALGTDSPASSLSLLQSCATAQNYYFNSPSTTQLSTIFSEIGDSLSNLRVSK